MKPIIIDMKNMSDSTEVYDSKPNRFMIYTIYIILLILIVAIIWMFTSKIEIVVKGNGVFKGSNAIYEISSGITGSVKESSVLNGQYVKAGDVLYILGIDQLSDTIVYYQNELKASNDRLAILSAYEKSLGGDMKALVVCDENPYYDEFVDRRELLYTNISLSKGDINGQASLYQGSMDSLSEAIEKYNQKIDKLNTVKRCVTAKNNTLASIDSYYYSMVISYLASYNFTALQYDNQINEYQRQIDDYEKQIEKTEEQSASSKTVSGNEIIEGNGVSSVEALKRQREILITERESTKKEKIQALLNLELQQISAVEQQIAGYDDTILSMETNLTSVKLQLEAVEGVDYDAKENAVILTERGNVAAEILIYQEKVKECKNYLKNYDIQNDNCTIRTNVSGYFYAVHDLKTGTYVQEGTAIGTIYPEHESKYYAEIYVDNSDIAKIKEGQEVKFEIAAYPSSQYGYFTGVVETIAKDISIDQSTGYAYYWVKIKCNHMTVKNGKGEEASLINGMACQAKIVIDEKNILTYLLEKVDLLD